MLECPHFEDPAMQHTARILREGKIVFASATVSIENCDIPNGFQGFGGRVLDPPSFSPLSGNYQLELDDGRTCDIVFFDKSEFRVNGTIT
jgi:hypothetical protein